MFSNIIYYSLTLLLTNALPFLVLPWLTKTLTVQEFGILALAELFGTITSGLSTQGLSLYYERSYFEYGKTGKEIELLQSLLIYSLTFVAVLGFLTFAFEAFFETILFQGSTNYPLLLVIIHFVASFRQLNQFFLSYFKCKSNGKGYMFFQVGTAITLYAAIIYFVIIKKGGLYSYAYSQAIVQILFFFCLFIYFIKKNSIVFRLSYIVSSLPHSLPLIPRIFMGIFNTQIDKYFLGVLATMGVVGAYSVTQKFSFVGFLFINMLSNVFTPKVYKKMFEGTTELIRTEIGKFLTPFFFFSSVVVLILGLFAKEMLMIFTDKNFHFAYPIIPILSFYYLILFFRKQNQLIFAKKTYILSVVSFFQLGLACLANYIFIEKYGFIGAAVSTLFVGISETLIIVWYSQKYYRINYERGKIAFMLSFVILSFGLTYVLKDYSLITGLSIKVGVVALFLLYGIINLNLVKLIKRQVVKSTPVPEASN